MAFFALGCALGVSHRIPSLPAEAGFYALCLLLICVGLTVGQSNEIRRSLRRIDKRLMWLPVLTIVGTWAGACLLYTSYIKWDANVELKNYGSTYLPQDKQSHIYIEYHRGLNKVLERIRAKYPDVLIQACGGGGGRASYGVLPYFDEFWVSDNTDALQRLSLIHI